MTLRSDHQEDIRRTFAALVDSTPVGVEFEELSEASLTSPHPPVRWTQRRLMLGSYRASWVMLGAFVVTLMLFVTPLVMLRGSTSPETANLSLLSPPTPDEILADGVVTETEYLAAGDAVVQCVEDQGYEAYFVPDEIRFGTRAGVDGLNPSAPRPEVDALHDCIASRMGSVTVAWSVQPYNPDGDILLYQTALECTESQTGIEYGEITQDSQGSLTADALNTIQRLLDEAPDVYPECTQEAAQGDG